MIFPIHPATILNASLINTQKLCGSHPSKIDFSRWGKKSSKSIHKAHSATPGDRKIQGSTITQSILQAEPSKLISIPDTKEKLSFPIV